jgi:hypothetical protein
MFIIPSTLEAEVEGSRVQVLPRLQSDFEASLGYIERTYLKRKQQQNNYYMKCQINSLDNEIIPQMK